MGITQSNFDGLTKVEVATKLLQAWEPEEGYYLAFSGGKDSVVIYDLAIKSGVNFDAHYCVSPIDPREVQLFIKEVYPEVIWDYHARGFWKMVVKKGLPMRQGRWCCQVIKEAGGLGRTVILGNRREEGTIRKKQKCYGPHRSQDKFFVRPIIDWNVGEVWEYIKMENLPYCSLYDEGFHRLGCILCPFERDVQRSIDRFPKITNLWRRACDRIVEYRLASGKVYKYDWQNGQEMWEWWIRRD